jgi:hypothetical protein
MGITGKQRGRHIFPDGRHSRITDIAADGTVAAGSSGIYTISKAGVCAITLAVPTGMPDGTEIEFRSKTANAHVVTVTGGFGGTGATRDVATFTAEVGAGFMAVVINALWHLRSTNLVTVA